MVLELREDTGAVDVEMDPVDMARVSEMIHAAGQRCGVSGSRRGVTSGWHMSACNDHLLASQLWPASTFTTATWLDCFLTLTCRRSIAADLCQLAGLCLSRRAGLQSRYRPCCVSGCRAPCVRCRVVGWYHSHPSFAALPSMIDIDNQRRQQVARRTAAGAEPYVGAIVGPWDRRQRRAGQPDHLVLRAPPWRGSPDQR